MIARELAVDGSALLPFSATDGRGTKELWTWVLTRAREAKSNV